MHVVDLRFVAPFAVKHLHAVVLAIRDINPTVGVAADIVRQVEFARTRSRPAPACQKLAVRRDFVALP